MYVYYEDSSSDENLERYHKELIGLSSAHKKFSVSQYLEFGLTTGQPKVLSMLREHEGYLQKDLARKCGVEPATMTSILTNMTSKGLIQKRTVYVSGGKRAFAIFLTDKGMELAEKVDNIIDEAEEKSFEGFSEEEKKNFIRMMHKITRNLET